MAKNPGKDQDSPWEVRSKVRSLPCSSPGPFAVLVTNTQWRVSSCIDLSQFVAHFSPVVTPGNTYLALLLILIDHNLCCRIINSFIRKVSCFKRKDYFKGKKKKLLKTIWSGFPNCAEDGVEITAHKPAESIKMKSTCGLMSLPSAVQLKEERRYTQMDQSEHAGRYETQKNRRPKCWLLVLRYYM